jgi:hypothetical protein
VRLPILGHMFAGKIFKNCDVKYNFVHRIHKINTFCKRVLVIFEHKHGAKEIVQLDNLSPAQGRKDPFIFGNSTYRFFESH